MLLLLATAAAEPPDASEAARLSEYYGRRLRHNADLVEDRWTVLEGGLALASRDFADKVGDADGTRRMNRNRAVWLGIGGVTAAAGIAWTALLTVPAVLDDDPDPGATFALVTGPALVALPLVAIHFASRPRQAPVSAFYDQPEAAALIEGYNRALAQELALDPAAVVE